jgi:competence protein ComK
MMRIVAEYLINECTVLVEGFYDECANLYSMVVDGEERLIVTIPPLRLINYTLLNHGSDFQGAVNSAKYLLGEVKMPPIHVNTKLDIWLIPTKSPKLQSCVWFSHSHIKKTKAVGRKKTEVHLSFGHTYELLMMENSFNHKRQRAEQLKEHITKSSLGRQSFIAEPKKGFYIRESEKEIFFKKEDSGAKSEEDK